MIFASLEFLYVFFPVCLLVYFALPGIKAKNVALTVLSLIFYAYGEPVWVILLVVSALTDYVNGLIIKRFRGGALAKAALVASLVTNLGLLAAFKYLNMVFATLGWLLHADMPVSPLIMPIGISFYTFQTLSYTIDVYRNKTTVQRNFWSFLLFVSLFPQLIAGPILRYSELAKQLDEREHTVQKFAAGLTRFMFGLGKKVLIANFCGRTADAILGGDLSEITVLAAWLGILSYAFQIYFDFSGYSDMAIGLGKIFGFEYGENFRYPYLSASITDFWRRWHISLGAFFRDYVYIPLGGNRKFQVRNIFVVWFLTGLWHGASWNFVLWGLFYGVLLTIEKFALKPLLGKRFNAAGFIPATFVVTLFGWGLFYYTDAGRTFELWSAMLGIGHAFTNADAAALWGSSAPLTILAAFASMPLAKNAARLIKPGTLKTALTVVTGAAILLLSTAVLIGAGYNPFLYFRF